MPEQIECFQAADSSQKFAGLLCQCGPCPCFPCTQVYGATYLQKLLEPLLRTVITSPEWQHVSFEVDPTRFEIQGEQQMFLSVNMIATHCV